MFKRTQSLSNARRVERRVVEMSTTRTRFELLTNRRVVNYSTSRLDQRRVVPKFYANALLRSAIAEKLRDARLWTYCVRQVRCNHALVRHMGRTSVDDEHTL